MAVRSGLLVLSFCFGVVAYGAACGSSGNPGDTSSGGGGSSGSSGSASSSSGGGTSGSSGSTPVTSLFGIWQLAGTDATGAYTGQLELRDAGGGNVDAVRIVQYTSAVVEDGRELWTAWTGTGSINGLSAKLAVSLVRADWVKSRGGVTRTDADQTPLAVTGDVSVTNNAVAVHWSAAGLTIDDSLSAQTPNGAAPIFANARASTAAYATPDATTLASMNTLYASFQALPNVAPYANDPAFKAGIAYLDTDLTDLDFYRAHPNALRVIDKVVDAPSLGETLARANAFRKTLADKATYFDQETPATFLEPATGQVVDSVRGGVQSPTGDGALWSASYLASQSFRYFVTKDPVALQNIAKVAAGIQLLMEISPDQTQFARTIRAATGAPPTGWHTGLGAFSAYEWLEGGNNDMFKGLFYGTLMAYATLCDPVISGQETLCARLRTNAKHMINDLAIAQGNATAGNNLLAAWLDYYLNGGSLTTLLTDWAAQATVIQNAGFQTKEMATADWSGTHLTFVEFMGMTILNARRPIPAIDATTTLRLGIEKMQSDFSNFRMGLWSVLFATKVTTPNAADIANARDRLREMPLPRMQLDIDHRVSASFVMCPFPQVPWKNDWTTTDRSDSLYGFPLYELPLDIYMWRSGPFDYQGDHTTYESPSIDFLHSYWLGRYLGLFTTTD